jgi:hypothetical protein
MATQIAAQRTAAQQQAQQLAGAVPLRAA